MNNYIQNAGQTANSLGDITDDLLKRHLQSFQNNDLESLMADYTHESLLISHVDTYTGIEQIKAFFVDLITYFPKQRSSCELDKKVIDNELAYIVWHAKTPSLEVSLG